MKQMQYLMQMLTVLSVVQAAEASGVVLVVAEATQFPLEGLVFVYRLLQMKMAEP